MKKISERNLRRFVSSVLAEVRDTDLDTRSGWRSKSPEERSAIMNPTPLARGESLVGKKFSYEDKGFPQCVIIASSKDSKNKLAKVYSAATIKDPVERGFGKIPDIDVIESIDTDLVFDVFAETYPQAYSAIKLLSNRPDETSPGDLRVLYNSFGIFVPDMSKLKRPAFESTAGAFEKSTKGECAISWSDFILNMFVLRYDPTNLKGALSPDEHFRTIQCLQSRTLDSNLYAVLQMILTMTGAGYVVEILSDLIPGLYILTYHIKQKNWADATRTALQVIACTLLPAAVEKAIKYVVPGSTVKRSIGQIVATLISFEIVFGLIEMIHEKILGESGTPTAIIRAAYDKELSEIASLDDFVDESKKAMLNPALKKLIDPAGLKQQYPDI